MVWGRTLGFRQGDHRVAGPGLVVLDGAHTPAAAASLATTLNETFPTQRIALVVAMANDKVMRAGARGGR